MKSIDHELYDACKSGDQREMVGVFWTGDFSANTLRHYQVAQSSGTAIHDMHPVSYWQDEIWMWGKIIVLNTDSNGVKYSASCGYIR
jgi:hypothetical protein